MTYPLVKGIIVAPNRRKGCFSSSPLFVKIFFPYFQIFRDALRVRDVLFKGLKCCFPVQINCATEISRRYFHFEFSYFAFYLRYYGRRVTGVVPCFKFRLHHLVYLRPRFFIFRVFRVESRGIQCKARVFSYQCLVILAYPYPATVINNLVLQYSGFLKGPENEFCVVCIYCFLPPVSLWHRIVAGSSGHSAVHVTASPRLSVLTLS